MCIIDEKQEAIARIRLTVDNDIKARLNLESIEEISEIQSEDMLDLESESSKTWRLGSPEGKKRNIRALAEEYCSFDDQLRDFLASNMPEEAVQIQFEDDIYVRLEISMLLSSFIKTFT